VDLIIIWTYSYIVKHKIRLDNVVSFVRMEYMCLTLSIGELNYSFTNETQ